MHTKIVSYLLYSLIQHVYIHRANGVKAALEIFFLLWQGVSCVYAPLCIKTGITTCGLEFKASGYVYCSHYTLACIISSTLTNCPVNTLWACNSLFFLLCPEVNSVMLSRLHVWPRWAFRLNITPNTVLSNQTELLVLFLDAENDRVMSQPDLWMLKICIGVD